MGISMQNLTCDRDARLKKHINAIHCSNNLSLVQRKLFNGLLFNAYDKLLERNRFTISTKKLCKLIGYNSNDYKRLKEALLGLITTVIEWNVVDASSNTSIRSWGVSTILSSALLKNGICTYEYSEMLKEFLYRPEIYGKVDIGVMAQFKSSYGLALYENCIRYQNLPQTPWFSLSIFRKLMGVADAKYTAFKDFKKRVLDIAIKEVNLFSPINISYEIQKEGKDAASIKFKINKKKSNIIPIDESQGLKSILIADFGLSLEMVAEVSSKYEEDYIKQKIQIVRNSNSFKSGKISDLAGYILNALRKDYQAPVSSKNFLMKRNEIKAEHDRVVNDEAIEEAKLKDKYTSYIGNLIDRYLNLLSEEQNAALLKEFENNIINDQILRRFYKSGGLEHAAIKSSFRNYVKNKTDFPASLAYLDFKEIFKN